MAKGQRIGKLAREWNVGVSTLVEYLKRCGVQVEETPNAKIDEEAILLLEKEFGKLEAKPKKVVSSKKTAPPIQSVADAIGVDKNASVAVGAGGDQAQPEVSVEVPEIGLKVKGKINLSPKAQEETQKPQTGSDGENSLPVVDVLPELRTVEEKEPSVEACTVEAQGENVTESVSSSETESSEQVVASESSVAAPKESAPIEVVSAERTAKRQLKVVGKIDLEAQPRSRRGKGAQLDKRSSPSSAKPEPVAQIQESKPDLVETVETVAETPVNRVVSEVQGEPEREVYRTEVEKLAGPTVLGKIDLTTLNERTRRRPEASATPTGGVQKRRKRKLVGSSEGSVRPQGANQSTPHSSGAAPDKGKRRAKPQPKPVVRPEISMTDVEDKIKETHARIASKRGSAFAKGAKFRKEKRHTMEVRRGEEMERLAAEGHVLRIREFISVNELAGMMDVPVTDVITTCMNMGVMVSINMRLDAETIALVADEYDYTVEFLSAELDTEKAEDRPEDLRPRTPVFTVLGHVDHGKTSLCDAIRQSNVTAVEKGGITQHLGAYSVELPSGKRMTLIDTPGHEAFTAMRARGAKMTDVAIIVVSAEDGIMPQTIEAINHASVTGARLVFAINKIDSPKANVDKVKEELANHNYLVEEWGGKYQSQDISAKFNQNIDLLLEKVLLEAEMLELTANPFRKAECTVIESFVDKGRGHCANVLVRAGTLRKGVPIVCGSCYGRVKAIYDDKENELKEAGPATPVVVVGLNGAPQAGDTLLQMDSDREAKATAAQIGRIRRTQEMRTRKHITLDEIGRRIAIGNFQELNVIVKGDVDGSVEALSDMLVQLSTEEIQVNVVHRGVGQITETDVTLATTSNAIIVGFQVRPSIGARRMAEAEQVDIRTYSVIYAAHDEIKSAMEGMLSPELKEEVIGTAEVLETFHISKVGTIAGCMVREGKIVRNSKVRIIRDGIVVYTSELATLKRFKDDAKEVTVGMDCGIGIKGYNDIKVGDFFEAFKEVEVKRTLD